MGTLLWVLAAVGGLALLGLIWFFAVILKEFGGELLSDRRHAKALFAANGAALTGKFKQEYPAPKLMLLDRSTIPYADEESFGSHDHYLLSLAAVFNAQRDNQNRIIGGYFDKVSYFDADLGPVKSEDRDNLRDYCVQNHRIKSGADLNNVLGHFSLQEMGWEVSQVLAVNQIKAVPKDLREFYDAHADTYARGLERYQAGRPLDLRSYRLVVLIHLARIGASLDWITEEEAWSHIRRLGFELRARVCRYRSWEAYGEMLSRCHHYLEPEAWRAKGIDKQLKWLAREECSPWKKIDFHFDEAQKAFASKAPDLRLPMPAARQPEVDFPEFTSGQYLDAGQRLIDAESCAAIDRLIGDDNLLSVPHAELDALLTSHPNHAGLHLLAGYHAFQEGRKARGTATANRVSAQAFSIFEERCCRAYDLAKAGMELALGHHGFVDLIIEAADHTRRSDLYGDLYREALNLAGERHLNDLSLQFALLRPQLEKWGGSVSASFGLARDRMARSENPMAGLLLVAAAVEYVILGPDCGGSDGRHKDFALHREVHGAAADLLRLSDPDQVRHVRRWLLYWAYAADDVDMLIKIGPFDGSFDFDIQPWIYAGETMARVKLAMFSDIANTAGHPEWLRLTGFYDQSEVPTGPLQ
ncbi:MAG: DUF1266 domain-containing protein [Pseudomonadota bacterium]